MWSLANQGRSVIDQSYRVVAGLEPRTIVGMELEEGAPVFPVVMGRLIGIDIEHFIGIGIEVNFGIVPSLIPGEAVVQLSQLEVGGHKHLVMRLRPDDLLLSGLARDVWLRGKRPLHAGHNVIIECCN